MLSCRVMVVQVGIEPTCVLGTEGYSLLPFRSSHCTMERPVGNDPTPTPWQGAMLPSHPGRLLTSFSCQGTPDLSQAGLHPLTQSLAFLARASWRASKESNPVPAGWSRFGHHGL